MIYILYYNYKHTADNHAGMTYLAKYLASKNSQIKLVKHIRQERRAGYYVGVIYSWWLILVLFFKLKKEDDIFFMEYLNDVYAHQHVIARALRVLGKKNKFVGLLHLAGNHLLEVFHNKETILKHLEPLDAAVVMGSSLKSFVEETSYKGKIIQTFHYADTNFYKPGNAISPQPLEVFFVGNIKRDFGQLKDIISQSNGVKFHICIGRSKNLFGLDHLANTTIYPFLTETELLSLMQKCHVNLSVLEDTVGSNAITGGLSAGMIQVVSDVGSIRDYCDDSNSFFCKETADFLNALTTLNSNPQLVSEMQRNARNKAEMLSLSHFELDFVTFFN